MASLGKTYLRRRLYAAKELLVTTTVHKYNINAHCRSYSRNIQIVYLLLILLVMLNTHIITFETSFGIVYLYKVWVSDEKNWLPKFCTSKYHEFVSLLHDSSILFL